MNFGLCILILDSRFIIHPLTSSRNPPFTARDLQLTSLDQTRLYGILKTMKAKKSPATSMLKFVGIELIGDVLYWPLWWYTQGVVNAGRFCIRELVAQEERLGLTIWATNIFTPMFGQYDWEGRLISFFMRLLQIIVRGVALLVWAVVMVALFLGWLLLPLLIAYQIVLNVW